MKKVMLTIPVVLLFISATAQIQIKKNCIDNGGATYTIENTNIIFTLGETFVAETTNGDIHISEGFIGKDFSQTSNIENIFTKEMIDLYPNPASDILFLKSKENIKYISISDITGKTIFYELLNSRNPEIKVSNLQNGLYFINIKTNNSILTKKFIKR